MQLQRVKFMLGIQEEALISCLCYTTINQSPQWLAASFLSSDVTCYLDSHDTGFPRLQLIQKASTNATSNLRSKRALKTQACNCRSLVPGCSWGGEHHPSEPLCPQKPQPMRSAREAQHRQPQRTAPLHLLVMWKGTAIGPQQICMAPVIYLYSSSGLKLCLETAAISSALTLKRLVVSDSDSHGVPCKNDNYFNFAWGRAAGVLCTSFYTPASRFYTRRIIHFVTGCQIPHL